MIKDELDLIIYELKNNGTRLLYCFVDPGDKITTDSIEKSSGLLVDSKITFFAPISEKSSYNKSDFIRPYALKFPSEKLKDLALQSGIFSRFKIDPNFRNNEFEKLYKEWIERSVKKELSDEVLVYYEDNTEKGFVTVSIKNNVGTIGLIAVDENVRGKSIGKKLMSAALYYLSGENVEIAEVATQKANVNACRFYKAIGFEIKNIVNVYHLWIR
jgi:dTDP-4-amino-4,6-dideoxy-D-galactose acyltransferase